MEAFYGTWKQQSADGIEEVVNRLKVGTVTKVAAKNMKLTMRIGSPSPNVYQIVTTSGGLKMADVSFRLGEIFEDIIPGGVRAKVSRIQ